MFFCTPFQNFERFIYTNYIKKNFYTLQNIIFEP